MRPTFKLVSKYPVDIKAEETEENNYKVLFASADIQISQPITKDEYIEYRDTFYVSPSKAKTNYLINSHSKVQASNDRTSTLLI